MKEAASEAQTGVAQSCFLLHVKVIAAAFCSSCSLFVVGGKGKMKQNHGSISWYLLSLSCYNPYMIE